MELTHEELAHGEKAVAVTQPIPLASTDGTERGLRFSKTTAGFFLVGVMIGLPAMVTGTSANEIFTGFTGVYEIANSVVAAAASFGTPFMARYISFNTATWICCITTGLAYVICTLPKPLSGSEPDNVAGPIIGAMLGGFLYAFGTNMYLAAAAFFPQEAVLALSSGSGLSVVLGPAIYIGILSGFDGDWRRSFLVLLPTMVVIPLTWWGLMDRECRAAAERSRLASLEKKEEMDPEAGSIPGQDDSSGAVNGEVEGGTQARRSGHSKSSNERLRLLFKTLLPKYILPLMLCTTSATVSLMGSAPTLQDLMRFRRAPEGNLQFQLVFLSYGAAQFIFSTLAGLRPVPIIWGWTLLELALCIIGIIQLFHPFLTYYGVWVVVMFFVGGCVGAGVTNTNYRIAEDFRAAGARDEIRSFAMSFAGAGNFGGDAIGGALGVLMEQLARKTLTPGN